MVSETERIGWGLDSTSNEDHTLSEIEFHHLLSHLHVIRVEGGDIRSYGLLSSLYIVPDKPFTTETLLHLYGAVLKGERTAGPEGKRAAKAIRAMLPLSSENEVSS